MANEDAANVPAFVPTPSEPTTVLGLAMATAVQFAYITNDTSGAIEHFESLGVGPWRTFDSTWDTTVRVSFAWMDGGRTFEIVEPLSDGPPAGHSDEIDAEREIFPLVGGDGLVISFHHVGALMDVESHAILEAATQAGLEFYRLSGRAPGHDIFFIDTRATLGHWLKVHGKS